MENKNEVIDETIIDHKEAPQKTEGQHGNRNQIFNNCTVNIYEEGKAIEILEKQQTIDAKQSEWQCKLMESVVEMVSQVVKDYSAKITATAKEASKPASTKKTTNKK
jgi:hypothetical protein